ncbi:MAG TPA: hypothetical protein VFM61_01780 [Pseudidiomarina sp.]|nr:hypothetical protein [Pseudidiomarina sp.]
MLSRTVVQKIVFSIILLIACSFILIAVVTQVTNQKSSLNRNQLYQNLVERSGQLNRGLPKLLDRQTRFERTEVDNYGMRFIYSLINVDKFQYDESILKDQVEPQLAQLYCTDAGLDYFRTHADFVEFRYQDRKERHLFTLRYEPSVCTSA